jgi:uncharacterized protein DUF222
VQITMDLETLLGLRDNPADLHGYGPLPANLARLLAADADWQRFIQDPLTGAPIDLGRTRRHPDAALRRWIIARDRTCLFPGCYRPAHDCEPDHNPAWTAGGGSDKDTLHQLCPKHHKVRHHGWSYQRHPDRITWTSPHRQIYERYLREADLIGPHHPCPHPDTATDTTTDTGTGTGTGTGTATDTDTDTGHDDVVDTPVDDDQRLDIFLPRHRPGQPLEEIPWDIVQAFRLEDTDLTRIWPHDADGNPLDEYLPTPQEEQAILDAEDHRIYGNTQPLDLNTIMGRALFDRARSKQAWETLPDEPPF